MRRRRRTIRIKVTVKVKSRKTKKNKSLSVYIYVLAAVIISVAVILTVKFMPSDKSDAESTKETAQSESEKSSAELTTDFPDTTVPTETTEEITTWESESQTETESEPHPEPEPIPEPEIPTVVEPNNTDLPDGVIGTTAKGYSIERINGVVYVNGILIANKTYPLPESYYPGGLTGETESAYYEMQGDASAEGISIWCKSGFRSYVDQRIIYADYAQRDGNAAADRYSARPGHSEHQSGMALDLNSLDLSFADTNEGIWLKNNSWKYGFIIRYPEGKEGVTGYIYEPWHVRYVGKENAKAIYDSGLCLEEYLGITSSYQ